jgi:hypothetical protein
MTRQMSAHHVIEEIRSVETKHVTFQDDNFLLNAGRENEIADLVKAEGIHLCFGMECRTDSIARHPQIIEKWACIGLENVLLGLEGISDDILVSVNEHNTAWANNEAIRILHDNGVMIWGAFIVDPDWTIDQFNAHRNVHCVSDRQHNPVLQPLGHFQKQRAVAAPTRAQLRLRGGGTGRTRRCRLSTPTNHESK